MSTIAIVYTTTTGNTRYAAELLFHEFGSGQSDLLELTATEPSATPIENTARNSVATCWSEPSPFLTNGGN